ncbi:MAG TPA: HWE histidine kinase domain-containing protein [Caulobacteraceae bacterium]|nr:HWE histidine kinase domain-containing protein [Caulobacteraceae bacterium]
MTDNPQEPGLAPARPEAPDQNRAGLALAAAGLGEFEWDPSHECFLVSGRLAKITGLPAGPMRAPAGECPFPGVHPDDASSLCAAILEGLDRAGRFQARFRMLRPKHHQVLWLCASGAISRGEAAEGRIVGVVEDISKRKAEEDEREALVAELDHRVKNVLTSVQSLAAQSARRTVSLEAFLKNFAGRLEAMASAHTLLTATRWRGADIASIAAAELAALAPGQAHWHGEEIVLNARATNALTLALHELAANAVKFGALSVDAGRVEVSWRRLPAGGFELLWRERNGPSVTPPTRRGFGTTLLERVTGQELGGSVNVEFRSDGVRASIRADASALSPKAPIPRTRPPRRPPENAGSSLGVSPGGDIRGMRVLLVEDAVLLALELEAGLTEAGAEVVGAAASLEEAQAMIQRPFDVAVLDANLNGVSVRPVADSLARQGRPFIFATGYGDQVAAPEGFDAPVVRKPYNVHQIAAALALAAGRS